MESKVRDLRLRTGITVPCLVQGDAGAQPVLLLHPWGESRRSFDRLIPLLDGFRVYAPDLRGQGEADKPEAGYSLAEQAEDAAAILDALNVPQAFVVGSSSGGYVAQQLAVVRPEKVAALVLVGCPLSLQGRPGFADEVDTLADPIDEGWVRDSLSWFPLLHAVPPGYIEDRVRDGLRMPAHAWKGILNGLSEASPPTESGTILAPTLILWGAEDNLLPRSDQETLAARIPGARLLVYPGVGHMVLWECPEPVAEDTTAFFRTLARRPPTAGRTAPGFSARALAERLKEVYENLPLPLPTVAALALDLILDRLRPMPFPGPRSLYRVKGAALLLAGVGLNVWALAERRRRSAGPFALERPEELVTTGPYAFTRHPMYVGWWLIQLGAGTFAGSSWVLVTLPAEVLMEHPFILDEETVVAGLFPQSYPDYAERVPRYIGFPRT
jgi:rifampin ADP-ribosylating transferase